MTQLRFDALRTAQQRVAVEVAPPAAKISDYFGENVFGIEAMRRSLSSENFTHLTEAISTGERISKTLADAVAAAMKNWAMEKGVTHYTHWFQPLTGTSAEKHDAFFEIASDGRAIERFKGAALIQQEPDASSFPSGGLRNTFEARGYSAWDPTSPAFIIENGTSKTLCIPTIFVSYTGVALDYKAPLLKSLDLLNNAAVEVCQLFDKNVTKVTTTLGVEQEFFLVDKALYLSRPDLLHCGRTVLGHAPAKGQQLSDHYFGAIPTRVLRFMQAFEIEALKLGIPIRTRHNEVAPNQFECAPTFEEVNIAVDHNLLLMEVMQKVADKHGLRVLFHEKPFAGVNGSGKHNNWSLQTNTGRNLLAPSSKAKDNLWFLTFFVNTLMAVHKHADLLRASIASMSNDHRLGAHEAPPAIISAFIGSQMTAILDELESNGEIPVDKGDNMYMKLGIDKIPSILLDNTDRNRTSPFAFTGNKFEFRAVGSSANCAEPMTVLNTAVADQLFTFSKEVNALLEQGERKELAIIQVLRAYIKESKPIRFEADGYSKEWEDEAKKRGLSNVKQAAHALKFYSKAESKELLVRTNIYGPEELEARQKIMFENYTMKLQIEARIICDLALNHVIPACVKYQNILIENVKGLMEIGLGEQTEEAKKTITKINKHLKIMQENVFLMIDKRKEANQIEDAQAQAIAYCDQVKPLFAIIRRASDKLEEIIDDAYWPLAKYREMLSMAY